MTPGERLRATYELRPVDHLIRQEFYIWEEALARWKTEGLPDDWKEQNLFNFDDPGGHNVGLSLGWCEPPFVPGFEIKVVQDDGRTEVIQDWAGRWLRVFKGRRHGFMPDYVRHPVRDMRDWEEGVRARLDPADPRRGERLPALIEKAKAAREKGLLLTQGFVGGYMYLRALMGPEDLLYAFCDQPELIHAMMRQWALVTNAGLARIQAALPLDEIKMGEDICYNHGLLISPEMVRKFLFPYYREVVESARARQKEKLFFFVDTDGWCGPAIPLYQEVGMDGMWPFEVASGCDVVAIGRQYPKLIMTGGIDKRVLAEGKAAIDRHLEHILPAMVKRGGYFPTCDHGVPDNVSLEDYLYYRKRVCEMDH